tara:strand:- start:9 stop:419 length:411 start_codon:yes stop_codon:yes gene_type:complete
MISSVYISGVSFAGDKSRSLILIVENNSIEKSITCDLYLAHWFSYEIGELNPGHSKKLHMTLHAPGGLLTIKNDKNVDMAISGIHCRSQETGDKFLEHWTAVDKLRTNGEVFTLSCVLVNELYCSDTDLDKLIYTN